VQGALIGPVLTAASTPAALKQRSGSSAPGSLDHVGICLHIAGRSLAIFRAEVGEKES